MVCFALRAAGRKGTHRRWGRAAQSLRSSSEKAGGVPLGRAGRRGLPCSRRGSPAPRGAERTLCGAVKIGRTSDHRRRFHCQLPSVTSADCFQVLLLGTPEPCHIRRSGGRVTGCRSRTRTEPRGLRENEETMRRTSANESKDPGEVVLVFRKQCNQNQPKQ